MFPELNEDQRMQYLYSKENGMPWEEKGEGSISFDETSNFGSNKKPLVGENGKIKLKSSAHFLVYAKVEMQTP